MKSQSLIYGPDNKPVNYWTLYDGANPSRHRAQTWGNDTDSKQTLDTWTRTELLNEARSLYGNVGFVKGAIRALARYTFGGGWIPQSQATAAKARDAYETYFQEWTRIADTNGQWSWAQLCRLQSIGVDVDGDIGRLYVKTSGGYPKLQLIRAHRIKTPAEADNSKWVDGVRVTSRGAPVAYSVSSEDGFKTYPVESFALVRDPDAPDEYRGKTSLHHGINSLQDIREILVAEKTGVKTNSSLALVLKMIGPATDDSPHFGPQGQVTIDDTNKLTLDRILAGMIPRLQEGEDIWSHSSDRPSPTFTGFLDYLLRDVAVGLGLPWEFVWDPSRLGGPSNRVCIRQAERRFQERQDMFGPHCSRDYQFVISSGIDRGELPADPFWWAVRWQKPPQLSIDAGRDAAANLNDLKYGIRTHAGDAGERGEYWEDERNQTEIETKDLITRAQRISKATGTDFNLVLGLLQQRSPNPPPPPPDTTPPPGNPTSVR